MTLSAKPIGLKRTLAIGFGFVVVLGAYASLSVHFRRVGLMVPDESFYTFAARAVWEGEISYGDFAYTQMPLVPYINGLAMRIIGYGMDNHRLISSIWAGLGLIALVAAVRQRLGRWEPAFLAAFAVAASPRWCFLQSMGNWCGAAGLFLNLALASVLWRGPFMKRAVLFAVFGTISIGCRLTGAPIIAVLAAALLLEARGVKERVALVAVFAAAGAAAFLPFIIAAPDEFYFMNWVFHMESQLNHPLGAKLLQGWDVSPAAIVIQAIGLIGAVKLAIERKWTEIILLVAGVVALVVPMLPKSAWGSYLSSSVPIAAVAGVTSIWSSGMAAENPNRLAMWIFPLMSVFHMTPLEVPEGAATEVEEVAAFIRTEVDEGPLLTPANLIAVESGRDVVRGTEMGKFSAMHPWEEQRAKKYHMTTLAELIKSVDDLEPAAIIMIIEPVGWRLWNFQWAMPSLELQPKEYIDDFENTIEECYEPAWRTSTMEVFVRRKL